MPAKNEIIMHLHDRQTAHAGGLFQYDYGQKLIFTGVDLPSAYEVHFSNEEHGKSKTMIGDETGVIIPDEYLLSGAPVYVWVFLHEETEDGETQYNGVIDVKRRAKPTDTEPTPVQQDVITQAIAVLNDAAEKAEAIVDMTVSAHSLDPEEEATVTKEIDPETGAVNLDFGIPSGDSTALIDDTAGEGDTDKTWSADKLASQKFVVELTAPTIPGTPVPDLEHITCNKTIAEMVEAYNAGHEIVGYFSIESQGTNEKISLQTNIVDFEADGVQMLQFLFTSESLGDGGSIAIYGDTGGEEDVWTATMHISLTAQLNFTSQQESRYYAGNMKISNVGNPVDNKDAANKQYVDTKLAKPATAGTAGQVLTSDGNGGQSWQDVGAGAVIDDTAGSGDTDKAWSANKLVTEFDAKADKTDTVLDTTLSRGRKANTTVGEASFAFGNNVEASGNYSHAEGVSTTASGIGSHSEGLNSISSGMGSHAESGNTTASGNYSHSEGSTTIASGSCGHAEGQQTTASGYGSHAEGGATVASGMNSHAGGTYTEANGKNSIAMGCLNVVSTLYPQWVSGTSYAVGDRIIDQYGNGYECKTANSDTQFTQSKWTAIGTTNDEAFVIGNGYDGVRSNAMKIDWEGNARFAGNLYVGCNSDSTGGSKLATTNYVDNKTVVASISETQDIINGYGGV